MSGNHPTYQEVQEMVQRAVSPPGPAANGPGAGNQLDLIKQVLGPIEILAEATKAMAGKKEGCDPAKARAEQSLVFSGKENTMPLDVWFQRLNTKMTGPQWTDEKKILYAQESLCSKSELVSGIRTQRFETFESLVKTLECMFEKSAHVFQVLEWSKGTRRFKGTSFANWLKTSRGIYLFSRTSPKWDAKELSDNEVASIMNALATLVPVNTLAKYIVTTREDDGLIYWNYEELRKYTFKTIMDEIMKDERISPMLNPNPWAQMFLADASKAKPSVARINMLHTVEPAKAAKPVANAENSQQQQQQQQSDQGRRKKKFFKKKPASETSSANTSTPINENRTQDPPQSSGSNQQWSGGRGQRGRGSRGSWYKPNGQRGQQNNVGSQPAVEWRQADEQMPQRSGNNRGRGQRGRRRPGNRGNRGGNGRQDRSSPRQLNTVGTVDMYYRAPTPQYLMPAPQYYLPAAGQPVQGGNNACFGAPPQQQTLDAQRIPSPVPRGLVAPHSAMHGQQSRPPPMEPQAQGISQVQLYGT